MSDPDLRELERGAAAGDQFAIERLQTARVRVGLGWHGEQMPRTRLVKGGQSFLTYTGMQRHLRGIYDYVLQPMESIGGVAGAHRDHLRIQMVYVPGGERLCAVCKGSELRADRRTKKRANECGACRGTGRVAVKPFYIGRFPMTVEGVYSGLGAGSSTEDDPSTGFYPPTTEDDPSTQLALTGATRPHGAQDNYRPIIYLTREQILSYCTWAGLRLPTAAEWLWAALGAPIKCATCHGRGYRREAAGSDNDIRVQCLACRSSGLRHKLFPWGDDEPAFEWCVFGGALTQRHTDRPSTDIQPVLVRAVEHARSCQCSEVHIPWWRDTCSAHNRSGCNGARTGPLVPARSAGASWCGAHDMAGNVYELDNTGQIWGGCFRSHWMPDAGLESRNDGEPSLPDVGVGFRVALSAPASTAT